MKKPKIVKLKSWEEHFRSAEKMMKGVSVPDEDVLVHHVVTQQLEISEPVKPKYQIGDSVFRLTVGGIREFNVWGIMKMLNGEFYYTFTLNSKLIDFNDWRSEQELFPTKEALLASL